MTRIEKIFLIVIFFLIAGNPALSDEYIKKPNVSGQFYSADPTELSNGIQQMISAADVTPYQSDVDIVIAPHAGYVYSGAVAAYSFKAVQDKSYSTIIVLAPSHFYGFPGISIWERGGFETPLGVVSVDEEFAQALIQTNPAIAFDPKAFAKEHSLEVELPFIQKTFPEARIVPVVMGQPNPALIREFAVTLNDQIGERDDILVVVSTDFSHYHDDAFARKMDARTIEAIQQLKAEEIYAECAKQTMELCGCVPVVTSLLLARVRGMNQVDLLKYAHSGEVSGDNDRVVGYGSLVFTRGVSNDNSVAKVAELNRSQRQRLMSIAKEAIVSYVSDQTTIDVEESDDRLNEEEGAFISIYKNGRLRGCMGNILGRGPLCLTVKEMAISSAIRDPRFDPLSKEELDDIELELSVLSKPWRIYDVEEIQLGVHGVIVSKGRKSGIFLPQVATSTAWNRDRFLSELCSQKAGLPADCWKNPKDVVIEIFTADVFSEKDLAQD